MKYPLTQNETINSLLAKGANRNWVESLAYESGIDVDHIRGKDDELSTKENNNEEI